MKRTGEFVLSIIGVSIAMISLIIGIITTVYVSTVDLTEVIEDSLGPDMEMAATDMEMTLQLFNVLVWVGIVSLSLALLGGLIAIILLKKGNVKAAGILFIITGILTIFHLWPLIFFIIPGIMCLARKPRFISTEEVEADNRLG
ncbi:DUF4064 domain-containing protein [Peribacillus sp. NPDC097675]|uniref:DUF4064 domain-containing protein n=1 Tax=Peribacillus sp. NPDC097675 TaxID=3390618 RepID=UPI003D016C05